MPSPNMHGPTILRAFQCQAPKRSGATTKNSPGNDHLRKSGWRIPKIYIMKLMIIYISENFEIDSKHVGLENVYRSFQIKLYCLLVSILNSTGGTQV